MEESESGGRFWRWLRWALAALGVVVLAGVIFLGVKLQERADIEELGWPQADAVVQPDDSVTVTWLGVTSLLFDDGETQILIDGFFTRFGLTKFLFGDIESDVPNINLVLSEYRITRLAAIIPVHSHFDHAMDVGVVANRSTAVVLGSESTANIARGARLPVHQYQILADGETRQFGDFTITLIASRHAPVADGKSAYFPGSITEPLRQPADVGEWKQGVSYTVVLAHPRGTALVQGSAGFIPDKLSGIEADVVMLGIGGLAGLGARYTRKYWRQTVSITNATRVYPLHYDDFNRPFGDVVLFPTIVDDAVQAATWISELAEAGETPVDVRLLPFGKKVAIF